jgi:hypothetical protein
MLCHILLEQLESNPGYKNVLVFCTWHLGERVVQTTQGGPDLVGLARRVETRFITDNLAEKAQATPATKRSFSYRLLR